VSPSFRKRFSVKAEKDAHFSAEYICAQMNAFAHRWHYTPRQFFCQEKKTSRMCFYFPFLPWLPFSKKFKKTLDKSGCMVYNDRVEGQRRL